MSFDTQHHFSSGVYAKEMHLARSHYAVSHKHKYDHLSILASGVAVVECDNEAKLYTAPACITIKAGVNHKITALDDVVWFCIHATEETDASKVDAVLIQEA